jgi:glucose-1-phosphate cytidylyltransferase
MKVVLFCGGLGLRMLEHSDRVPKPMVPIGNRPVLWHVMKYYAHFGHKDFILCLGHKAEVIKSYFLSYDETVSNDFVISNGGRDVELLRSDIDDWRITFVDTGLRANIGQRLMKVRKHLEGEEIFLANYADAVTDAPLPDLIERFEQTDNVASMLCVRPNLSFHLVTTDGDAVRAVEDVRRSEFWINGGYFVLRREIFDYLGEGEELVMEPFQRLMAERRLLAYRYDGFFEPMDTLKDKTNLDSMVEEGNTPWRVWENGVQAEDPVTQA